MNGKKSDEIRERMNELGHTTHILLFAYYIVGKYLISDTALTAQ